MQRIPQPIQFQLEKGDIVHINGIPFEYIGDGVVTGNTDPLVCKEAEPTTKPEAKPDFQKALKDLAEALKEKNEEGPDFVDPRFGGKWPFHNPKGGVLLDPFNQPVYGPGCYSHKIVPPMS